MLRTFLPESLRTKTAAVTDGAVNAVTPAAQAEKAMRALTNPTAPPPATPEQPQTPNYDRSQLDRLINNQK